MAHHDQPQRTDAEIVQLLGQTDPEPPSTVDMHSVVHHGRRRVRRRRIVTAAGIAAVTVLATAAMPGALSALAGRSRADTVAASPSTAGLPAKCRITKLALPAGVRASKVTGADPTGRYILVKGGGSDVYVATEGVARRIDVPGTEPELTDVNSAGTAVAHSELSHEYAAWRYRDGTMTRLLGGDARAHAVNERGDIAGTLGGRTVDDPARPAIWKAGADAPTELPLPSWAVSGEAFGVAEDGTVVGLVKNEPSKGSIRIRGYVWRHDGAVRELPLPRNIDTAWADAFGIRGVWVTGRALVLDNGKPRGRVTVRWNLDTGEAVALDQLPEESFADDNTNRDGWLVGSTPDYQALLVTPDGDYTLPPLQGARSRFGDIARTVSDDGRTIAGEATDSHGRRHAVVWNCT